MRKEKEARRENEQESRSYIRFSIRLIQKEGKKMKARKRRRKEKNASKKEMNKRKQEQYIV
mgnify:CR=1 FL=1